MKRLFISIMAVAALVSCSKADIIYDDIQQQIGFSAVASSTTKTVAGYDGNTFDGKFPTNINLYVFANVSNDAGTAWNTPYFTNAKFKYNASKGTQATQGTPAVTTTGAYEGEPARYWPNVKTLKFAGYSDACGVVKNATMDFATNELEIPSYTQDNTNYTAEGSNDLMWFPCDGNAYDKQADEIAAQMKHACSWITVKVVSDGKYTDLKLHDLTINGLYHTGSVVCGESSAAWSVSGTTSVENVYTNTDGKAVSTTAAVYENTANNMIVIPQTPTTIDVTYSFVPQTGIAPIKETKTALSLSIGKETVNGTEQEILWKSGKHYIYTITITATEILIDPYVVDWTTSEHNDKTI